jgi:hypothetical protein
VQRAPRRTAPYPNSYVRPFVKTADADYNELFAELVGPR